VVTGGGALDVDEKYRILMLATCQRVDLTSLSQLFLSPLAMDGWMGADKHQDEI